MYRPSPIGYNRPSIIVARISEINENSVEINKGIYRYRDIAPIFLTENILINSGGNKVSDKEISFKDKNKIPTSEDFSVVIDSDKFYLNSKDYKDLSVNIESVLQFQNIYYDLKGKEISCLPPINIIFVS